MSAETWKSIGRGALVAAAGAALAALTSTTAGIDFGPIAGPFVSAALAIVANVLRKYATEARAAPADG